ncbi:MAG: transcription antitermination factor NusB [Patescibacteria group bacterium]|nr:transcription antitermination factor NusB [Patescibacteria group bacterium]
MNARRLARILAFQTIYQLDFFGFLEKEKEIKKMADDIFQYHCQQLKLPSFEHRDFAERIIVEVIKNFKKINEELKKFAPEWPVEQISLVDRNILRIGIAELLFLKETPAKVIIDEAIELAKTFGSETSGRFVNGVLGALYEEIKNSSDKISGTNS